MQKLSLTAFFFLLCILARAQRISIQPSILDFRVGAGGQQTQPVRITNLSDKKIAFQAYLADWLRDSTGSHQYFRPDTLSRSCASWVQLDKNFVEVEPNGTAELLVRMNPPADAAKVKEMKWAMLFVQSADEKNAADNNRKQLETQVKEILRVGIHIYETPPSLHKKTVSLYSFSPTTEKNVYEVALKNTGELMLQCKAQIELTDAASGVTYHTEKIEFPVFPGGNRKVKLPLPAGIPKGNYSALAIVDLGDDAPLEGLERTIEVQ